MANANSTASSSNDKFNETNKAVCEASYIAHFLLGTFLKHAESQDDKTFSNLEVEGLLRVLQDLTTRIEGSL